MSAIKPETHISWIPRGRIEVKPEIYALLLLLRHFSGQFNLVQPTERQIESAAILIADLCVDFDIPTDRKHIISHDECYNGSGEVCPGIYLQRQLDAISVKANWYRYTPADVIDSRYKNKAILKYEWLYFFVCILSSKG